jgi:hypothetical protein
MGVRLKLLLAGMGLPDHRSIVIATQNGEAGMFAA